VASTTWGSSNRKQVGSGPSQVWRPTQTPDHPEPAIPPTTGTQHRDRKGGIRFDEDEDSDEDLASFMHPDDVPPKGGGSKGGGSGRDP
jgi:hypothetical protein